jgi:NADPH-dependent 2,4-dienoyl-CoA reductase/sulfur reductase-like enzyme
MASDTPAKISLELIEQIEAEIKELRQAEALESQIREMTAAKRERVMTLWKRALTSQEESAKAIPPIPAPIEIPKRELPLSVERPFGAPGAPRDMLATEAKPASSKGATAILQAENAKKAPSAQQVFQSLNRLVGKSEGTLKQ